METKEQSSIRLSVVVTVYSETFSLNESIERLIKLDRGYISEIILVISPKSSAECIDICQQLDQKHDFLRLHMQQQNPGVGWAIREGMEMATGNYVALLSADLETEPEAVDRMVRKIEETGCDGVIGNRWLKGGGFQNYDPTKLILNWGFQYIFRLLYLTRLGDLTYGFKVLRKDMVSRINWEGVLHEIYIETTVKPLKLGFKMEQVPTVWIGRREGESKNTFLRNFRYVRLALDVLIAAKQRLLITE
ncbi:MAG: glycosyltransferase [Deltaproteobacteria bacterium]|jgi:glycosyltransferase involved in cell wall biosynthesis|nr:glycosyltransferase [Deltaproteobacteria bacterium]MBT4088912.1 glycosyltransferase [Deltaproteobacteria bacterium]MBT4264884.1 glycosyltransferase [Deltaproteobacteria bacterium]MBT4640030.1 glycosyltransferase [Deltaproteobacteria bacterium]MBT6610523.1 glycosyltransferase [Deltaproteobacteria bacterium]